MKNLSYFPLLLISALSWAQTPTEFTWIKSAKSIFKGKCLEVDKETKGKKFNAEVDKDNCRTSQTAFYFIPKDGKCYEIDEPSKGEAFVMKSDIENCRPNQTIKKFTKIMGKEGCFEIPSSGEWNNYYKRLNLKNCNTESTEYFFKLEKGQTGSCFTKTAKGVVKVKTEFCKPSKTVYYFERTKTFRGECYEQSSEGAKFYSKKTNLEACRPKDTLYIFYNDPENITQSNCYEVDNLTKGNQYLARVRKEKCKQ